MLTSPTCSLHTNNYHQHNYNVIEGKEAIVFLSVAVMIRSKGKCEGVTIISVSRKEFEKGHCAGDGLQQGFVFRRLPVTPLINTPQTCNFQQTPPFGISVSSISLPATFFCTHLFTIEPDID